MQVFRIKTAYREDGNSPWDALWYDGDDENIDVLDCEMRLGTIWRSPQIRLEKRERSPDIYVFHLHYAVSERAKDLLLPLVQDAAEFLPLSTESAVPLFVLHPLLRVDLGEDAVVTMNSVSGNIVVIQKYSFNPRELEEAMPIFQARQAVGSAARDAGGPCSGVLVSEDFCTLVEKNELRGVVFDRVF
jgi:hypothetical protein